MIFKAVDAVTPDPSPEPTIPRGPLGRFAQALADVFGVVTIVAYTQRLIVAHGVFVVVVLIIIIIGVI